MIFFQLFYTFLKIGLFTFGGGYAMIPLIEDEVTSLGWLTHTELYQFIGISEMTPGPFAINIATFVGSSQGGFLGAFLATLGVVLPSFIIILLIAIILKTTIGKNRYVQSIINGIKPVVIALIASAGFLMFMRLINPSFPSFNLSKTNFDIISLSLVVILFSIYISYLKIRKKPLHPIILISISAVFGIFIYSF